MDEQKNMTPQEGYQTTEELLEHETNDDLTDAEYQAAQAYTETIRSVIEKENEKESWLKELYEWVQAIAVAVVLALLINQFIFAMVQVSGSSMVPTLHDKERLVITKLFYTPKEKDIVVVKSHALGKHIIKRVIAVPGDTIDIHPVKCKTSRILKKSCAVRVMLWNIHWRCRRAISLSWETTETIRRTAERWG